MVNFDLLRILKDAKCGNPVEINDAQKTVFRGRPLGRIVTYGMRTEGTKGYAGRPERLKKNACGFGRFGIRPDDAHVARQSAKDIDVKGKGNAGGPSVRPR